MLSRGGGKGGRWMQTKVCYLGFALHSVPTANTLWQEAFLCCLLLEGLFLLSTWAVYECGENAPSVHIYAVCALLSAYCGYWYHSHLLNTYIWNRACSTFHCPLPPPSQQASFLLSLWAETWCSSPPLNNLFTEIVVRGFKFIKVLVGLVKALVSAWFALKSRGVFF